MPTNIRPAHPSPNSNHRQCLPKLKSTQAQLSSKLNLQCLMPTHPSIFVQPSPHPIPAINSNFLPAQPTSHPNPIISPDRPSPKPNCQLQCLSKLKLTEVQMSSKLNFQYLMPKCTQLHPHPIPSVNSHVCPSPNPPKPNCHPSLTSNA